jgi:predicted nucleic acid-binding protein
MRVVDTSAWIDWLTSSSVADEVTSELPTNEDWLVPTIVQHELAKWVDRSGTEANSGSGVLAFSKTCVVIPLTTELAILAASLGRAHNLASADAIIYATATAYGADLLTSDPHFEGLEGVIYISKRRH